MQYINNREVDKSFKNQIFCNSLSEAWESSENRSFKFFEFFGILLFLIWIQKICGVWQIKIHDSI